MGPVPGRSCLRVSPVGARRPSGPRPGWPDRIRDLAQFQAGGVELERWRYQLRTDLWNAADHVLATAGIRPPYPVTALGEVPMS